jgi:hypothetical protein
MPKKIIFRLTRALVTARALTRAGSDHTPLIIDSGEQAYLANKSIFSFELAWLRRDGFYEMVAKEWASISRGKNPMELWQKKICHRCNFLRG